MVCLNTSAFDLILWVDSGCTLQLADSGATALLVGCTPVTGMSNVYQTESCATGTYTPPAVPSTPFAQITTHDIIGGTCDDAAPAFGVQSYVTISQCISDTAGAFSTM